MMMRRDGLEGAVLGARWWVRLAGWLTETVRRTSEDEGGVYDISCEGRQGQKSRGAGSLGVGF